LYQWLDYPDFDREVAVIRRRVPHADQALSSDVARVTERMRGMNLLKPPGLAEAIDWTAALVALGAHNLDLDVAARTLGAAVKYHEDQQRVLAAAGEAGLT
jgi:MoxR-like ATPase